MLTANGQQSTKANTEVCSEIKYDSYSIEFITNGENVNEMYLSVMEDESDKRNQKITQEAVS